MSVEARRPRKPKDYESRTDGLQTHAFRSLRLLGQRDLGRLRVRTTVPLVFRLGIEPSGGGPSYGAMSGASRIAFIRVRSFRLARRMAPAITGAATFENPAGVPRLRRAMVVPPD